MARICTTSGFINLCLCVDYFPLHKFWEGNDWKSVSLLMWRSSQMNGLFLLFFLKTKWLLSICHKFEMAHTNKYYIYLWNKMYIIEMRLVFWVSQPYFCREKKGIKSSNFQSLLLFMTIGEINVLTYQLVCVHAVSSQVFLPLSTTPWRPQVIVQRFVAFGWVVLLFFFCKRRDELLQNAKIHAYGYN